MLNRPSSVRALLLAAALAGFPGVLHAQKQTNAPPVPGQAAVIAIEGKVEVSLAGSAVWTTAHTNQTLQPGDVVRTSDRSRAVVRLSNLSHVRLGEQSLLPIPATANERDGFNLRKVLLYFFHRDKPGTFRVRTPGGYAIIIGTEFSLEVDDDRTTLHLVDGHVGMTNEFGHLELTSGQSATAELGKAPAPAPSIEAVNAVQWCLYYPGIVDPDELDLPAADAQALADSLAAYRRGDLQSALARYPAGRQPVSDAEKVYLAALVLAVGQVETAEKQLAAIPSGETGRASQLAGGLRVLIAAVKFQRHPSTLDPSLSTALLAESYHAQSRSRLDEALAFARAAAARSTNFGFAWARVAELEFSFGRTAGAAAALDRARKISPGNAPAAALRGFVLAARNRIPDAIRAFDEAITLDGALGNAWLGRGLCRIRQGHDEEGRQDLQTAVMVEPQRAVLRSYLGKAYGNAGDEAHAIHELRRAREMDPNDPTAWLYSALLNLQGNRINEAVHELQKSGELTGNRGVYRSALQLDKDRAVDGVNRAIAFGYAGMADLAAREAGRAVDADPANYAAHQFLGNSYQIQRDLKGINQRFEAPAVSEFLIASLLSPVGAGTLAQSVSQQEYSKLFEADGPGLASSTEYFSNGDWIQSAAQYGTFGNSEYALSGYYRSDNGWRPNNDLLQKEFSVQLKQQVTPQDSVYVRAIYGEAEGGDLIPRYDPAKANTGLRFKEEQEPLLLAGWHHEWGPGSHSLVVGGWFRDDLRVSNPNDGVLVLGRDSAGVVTDVVPISLDQRYRSQAEFFTAEAQQILQGPKTALIAGGRFQGGTLDTQNQQTDASGFPAFPTGTQKVSTEFNRWSVYAYGHWQVIEPLRLVAGLSYDALRFPANFRFAPISSRQESDEQLSPKGGLVWTPTRRTTARFAYSQSLGGVGFEQSFRLEPTQVAGFNQAFRSILPESVAGATVDAPFETWAASLEQRIGSGTFVALSAELLESDVRRQVGVFDFASFTVTRGSTHERLDYKEGSLTLTLNQLVGDEWSFGARYRLSKARLDDRYTDIAKNVATLGDFRVHSETESLLHHVELSANYNHPAGFFGRFESLWYSQSNQGYVPGRPGDDFWQFNVFVGWRFLHRRIEARVGVLNLADRDYMLNPLNLTPELPRARTFTAGLRFNF